MHGSPAAVWSAWALGNRLRAWVTRSCMGMTLNTMMNGARIRSENKKRKCHRVRWRGRDQRREINYAQLKARELASRINIQSATGNEKLKSQLSAISLQDKATDELFNSQAEMKTAQSL